MNIQTEPLENRIMQMVVEADDAEWQKAREKAARRISKAVRIPGFRKGKAPLKIVERHVGSAAIIEESLELLADDLYPKALAEAEIEPYSSGTITKVEYEPMRLTFEVPLEPQVELGAYRDVRVDYEQTEVTEEAVEKALNAIRYEYAEKEPVEGEITDGLLVTVDVDATFADGEEAPEDENDRDIDTDYMGDLFQKTNNYVLDLTAENVLETGFKQAFLEARPVVGEAVDVELNLADNFIPEELAGRLIRFHVHVLSAEKEILPELDDELAARVTEDYETPLTLAGLRDRTREELEQDLQDEADVAYTQIVLDKIAEIAHIEYPRVMIENHIDDTIEDMRTYVTRMGATLEQFLESQNRTIEEMRESYRESSVSTVEQSLLLLELLSAEKIRVRDEDITAEANRRIDNILKNAETDDGREIFMNYLMKSQFNDITNSAAVKLVTERVRQIGRGIAPTMEEIEAAQKAYVDAGDTATDYSVQSEGNATDGVTGAADMSDSVAADAATVEMSDDETSDSENSVVSDDDTADADTVAAADTIAAADTVAADEADNPTGEADAIVADTATSEDVEPAG